ncbi:MAG: four helix bundle protein [Nitrospirota bacterium]
MEKPHKKLDAWRLAVELATYVYRTTDHFPRDERFGLTDQMRRAAVSIPSNIAEGAARKSKKEFAQFIHTARGSLGELDTHLELARRPGFLDEGTWKDLDARMKRIDMALAGLLRFRQSSHV